MLIRMIEWSWMYLDEEGKCLRQLLNREAANVFTHWPSHSPITLISVVIIKIFIVGNLWYIFASILVIIFPSELDCMVYKFYISLIFTYSQHIKVEILNILLFSQIALPSVGSVMWKLKEIIFDKLVDLLKSFPKTLIERRKVLKVQLVKSRKENTVLRKVEILLGPNWVFVVFGT